METWNDQDFLSELVEQGYTVGWPWDYNRNGNWRGLRVMTETHEEAARLQEHIWSYRNEYRFITEENGPIIIWQTRDGRLAVRHVTGCPSVTRAGWKASFALVTVGSFVYDEDIDLQRLLRKKENFWLWYEEEGKYMDDEFPHF